LGFLLVSENEIEAKRARFEGAIEIQEQTDRSTRCSKKSVPAVAETLDPLKKFARGQQRVTPNVSVYFGIDSIRKLLHTPSYLNPYLQHVRRIEEQGDG
jgi:hypothetical protein